ncbi:hypothetical protein IZ6_10950 [Terrihabitans soli]|uniref:Uncharacterized protein n=2 Tax=Terrihabitans soli TaxID=708113 RepID=A0A6S6QTT9_9HYPH|nr:hypothetical protein IZ6_10950 [Terrihabitans soli]
MSAAFVFGLAQAAQAAPVVYDCKWGSEKARLNFTDHTATYAGKTVDLKEGIVFGFDDPQGKYILFDIPIAIDKIHEKRPWTMSGVIRPDGDFDDPNTIPVRCTLRR